MQINCAMRSNFDILSLVENYLDKVSIEYQSFNNRIEIYQLDKQLMIIEIGDDIFSISYKKNKYNFETFDLFFIKLTELIN